VATDTNFRSQDGYLVGVGFEYERAESAFVPVDAEMYWNEGAFTVATKNVSVDGHAAAHRMYLQHLTSLSLVHGFSGLDGKSPRGAPPSPPHRPPNKLSRESIDVWQRTPLDLDFIDAWGLPLDAAHVEVKPALKNATCAETIASVAPSRRVLCDRPAARPLGLGNSTAQEKRCLSAGCCWDPVTSPGSHPWCFLPGENVPVRRKLRDANYTIGRYIEDHLGYRLSVQAATFPQALKQGTHSFTIEISVINFGFSIPQNRRPVHIVLMAGSAIVRSVVVSGVDIRAWQPRDPADPFAVPLLHEFSAILPIGDLVPGNYDIGVHLPDERSPLNELASAAIRFANDAGGLPWRVWGTDGHLGGVNIIGSVSISSSSDSPLKSDDEEHDLLADGTSQHTITIPQRLTAVAACVPFIFVEHHSNEAETCSELRVSGLPATVRRSVWSLAAEHLGVSLGFASSNQYEVSDVETVGGDDEVPVALHLSLGLLSYGASVVTVTLSAGQPSLMVTNTTVVVTVASTKGGLASVHLDRRKSRGLMVRVGEDSALPLIPFGAYIYDVDLDGNRAFPRVEAPQGLNLVAPYISKAYNHTDAEWIAIMEFLDNCSAVGMRVHYHLNSLAIQPDTPDKWSVLRTEVSRVKDHPAVLAYYIADGETAVLLVRRLSSDSIVLRIILVS
jgi:hypothetical protein